jgi:hypothetical protein
MEKKIKHFHLGLAYDGSRKANVMDLWIIFLDMWLSSQVWMLAVFELVLLIVTCDARRWHCCVQSLLGLEVWSSCESSLSCPLPCKIVVLNVINTNNSFLTSRIFPWF